MRIRTRIFTLLMVLYYYFDSHKYKDKFESFLTTEGHADKIGMCVMILFNVLFVRNAFMLTTFYYFSTTSSPLNFKELLKR